MTALTPKEFEAIAGIIDSDFHDGRDPVGDPVWSWSCNPFKSKRTFGGVVASLSAKGFVNADGPGAGDDACITLTAAGMAAYTAAKAAKEST